MTTHAQRQIAEEIAEEFKNVEGVASAVVDDFDDYGGFNFFVRLINSCPDSRRIEFTRPMHGIVQRFKSIVAKKGACWEWHEAPKRIYSYAGPRSRKFWDGYDTDSYRLSIKIPARETVTAVPHQNQIALI